MTTVRRITVSQINGEDANNNNTDEIRPFGETGFYLDENTNPEKLVLMMFDGRRTNIKSKVLSPGMLFGSNADSGDGANLDTIKLIPDATLYYNGSEQYITIDPTAPSHVHIRAGGAIDNSSADLFLGGENSYFKVAAGTNSQTQISANSHNWTFGVDGTFTLPTESGLNGSQINSVSNSSGDLNGYTTLQLIPDITLGTGTDQYLIIDPTAPGHIHIRAGGTQDNSSADLILGGEYSHFKIPAGANSSVYVKSNDNNWTFRDDGWTIIPGSIYSENTINLETPGDFNPSIDGNILMYAGKEFRVVTNNAINAKTWIFNLNGSIKFPDETIQTTAYPGTNVSLTLSGNLVVGNLTVNGNASYINTNSYVVDDNIIQMANANPGDTLDIGFAGHRTVASVLQHTGLVRDASENIWKLFSNVVPQIGTTVDFSNAVYDDLLIGNLKLPNAANLQFLDPSAGALSVGTLSSVGNIQFGDNTYQTTAFTGNAATIDITNTNGLTTVYYLTFTENRTNGQILRGDVDLTYRTDDNILTVGNIVSNGNITGGRFVGNGALLTDIAQISNGTSNIQIPTANGNITLTAAGANTWTFDNAGDLTIPGGAKIADNGTGIQLIAGAGGTVRLSSNNDTNFWIFKDNGETQLPLVSVSGRSGGHLTALGNVLVNANNNYWLFQQDGNLTLPSNSALIKYANGSSILAGISGGAGNYGDSNVSTFLASFGTNTLVTSGNVTVGNLITGNGINGYIYLGNANSRLTQIGSNSYATFDQNIVFVPDTNKSALAGVVIGGSGYLLGPNGGRVITLSYSGTNNVGLQANATVGTGGSGTLNVVGTATTGVNAILAGPTFTPLANTSAGFVASVNSYSQITFQNKSTGADATADYILTADNGSDTANYGDFGIINSGYDNATPTNSLGNIVYAADTYLYAQGNVSNVSQSGGNLAIGTTVAGKTVRIFAGGANASSIIATVSNTGIAVTGNISVSGNITGTTPNVNLVAGSYTHTFDNTGNVTIAGSGIRMPSRPAMRVYGNTSTYFGVGTTITGSNFIIDYNQASALNAGTGVFTAPVAGLYSVTLVARVGNNNGLNQVAVLKNDSTSGANVICFWETDTSSNTAVHFGSSGVANLAIGDTLRTKVLAGNIQFDSNDSWTVTYIG